MIKTIPVTGRESTEEFREKAMEGGLLIPEQFHEVIQDRIENNKLYYDTETGYKEYIYTKESPLVVRKYPKWKFWKHGFLIKCKSNRII